MNRESSIKKEHYYDPSYLKKERLHSYAEQIELLKKYSGPKLSILEIGKGNGYIYQFLRDYLEYNVKCLDINPRLNADYTDNIIDLKNSYAKQFDIVTCFEVLEHMPVSDAVRAVQNMAAIARKYLLISIPDMRYFYSMSISFFLNLPFLKRKVITFPRIKKTFNTFGADHYWELGIVSENQYSSNSFIKKTLFNSLQIIEDYRCFEVPWHHFYVLQLPE